MLLYMYMYSLIHVLYMYMYSLIHVLYIYMYSLIHVLYIYMYSLNQEKLISTLYNSATKESNRQSRILALYQVGMIVYSELTSPTFSTSSSSSHTHSPPKPSKLVPEGIDILLATLKVHVY